MKPSTHETCAEQLNAVDNKARYDERNARREELVSNLSKLLEQGTDNNAIVNRLTELGFKVPKGESSFEERSLNELKDLIRDGILQLEEASDGVLRVTNAVREDTASTTDTSAETAKGADTPQSPNILLLQTRIKKLQEIGGELWIDYDQMLQAYEKLKAKPMPEELTRVKNQFEQIILGDNFDRFVTASRNIRNHTEENKSPIIMPPRPKEWIIDNKRWLEEDSIGTMQKAANADTLWVSDYVPGKITQKLPEDMEDVFNKVWDSALTVWTSACLKGSKNKCHQDQLKHQADILGAEYGIEADMILPMALLYISGKEKLMRQDIMRLNTQGTTRDPLAVYVYEDELRLGNSRSDADFDSGIGASFRISS